MDPTGGRDHHTAVPLRWRMYSALEPPGSTRNQDRDGSSPRIAYLVEALLVGVILINSASLILWTMPSLKADCVIRFHVIEFCTIAVFLAEYVLRFWTAPGANPEVADWGQRWRYVGSPSALIDAPALFPSATAVVAPLVTGDGLSPVVPAGGSADYPLCEAGAVFPGWPSIGHGHAVEGKPATDHSGGINLRAGSRRPADVLYRVKCAAGRVQQHSGGDVVERRNADDSGRYGDTVPMTTIRRLLAAVIAVLGNGLCALPAGILSAGLLEADANDGVAGSAAGQRNTGSFCPHWGQRLTDRDADHRPGPE